MCLRLSRTHIKREIFPESYLPDPYIRSLSPSIFCKAIGVGTALRGKLEGRVKIPLGVGVMQEAGSLRVVVGNVGKLES